MTRRQRPDHVVVIGAGIGGLSAALDLAASGLQVTLFERQSAPGGKMHEVEIGAQGIDSGPTVFTMRWVFEELFADAGEALSDHVVLKASDVLARHSWSDGSRLDLYADTDRSVAAIDAWGGSRAAAAYRRFALESQSIFETLDRSFMRVERPGAVGLVRSLGLAGIPRLLATKPFRSLWNELGKQFEDPRLRQLFGRYATYCGSSPFDAPATLMLIAHAERAGVWFIDGGMQRLAEALSGAAARAGAELHFATNVERVLVNGGRATGVELTDGTSIAADAIVFNGDVAALSEGLLGDKACFAIPTRRGEPRSLSAITWSVHAAVKGFSLDHHNVFFSDDYADEFKSIFENGSVTANPTVYVCAQDRAAGAVPGTGSNERLLLLINAPPRAFGQAELDQLQRQTLAHLEKHGVALRMTPDACVRTSPNDYANRFPGSGGAIYGWPTHGWSGSFKRLGSRSQLRGLYLAGGTVHPGPGVPMTALSGRIAARSIRRDLSQR
jgi:1-hydroxycarotenoid 3,4-desaturase